MPDALTGSAVSPEGPVLGLLVGTGILLLVVAGRALYWTWKHDQEDRAIRGEFDTYLPDGWSSEKAEELRQRILERERRTE